MAMNSYIRQTSISADQMHSFLKDKQAWENAIALYQGPDPLDHWWNYICWYENHGHGDPENKFRETLERCLTIYEHSDYYKQDVRMVRLWLKYIDMQTNPLHFYQVLHQRGVGKQVACFYVSWAEYYESIQAYKEAEAVYNLGFQEKAQPYAELHHGHSKLLYTRTIQAQSSVQPHMLQHQHQQLHFHHQQQQQQQQHQQQQQQQHHQHIQMQTSGNHTNAQLQQQQATNLQHYRQHVAFQQQGQHHPLQAQVHIQQQQHQHQHQHQHQQQIYQQNSHNHYSSQQQELHNHVHTQHEHVQHHSHNRHMSNQVSGSANNIQQITSQMSNPVATAQQQQSNVVIEQQLPVSIGSTARQDSGQIVEMSLKCSDTIESTSPESKLAGIRLPRKFANYCRNNFETWRPALFLEEPYDPNRRCHYSKNLVYPEGSDEEFSPEELRARQYIARRDELEQRNTVKEEGHNHTEVEEIEILTTSLPDDNVDAEGAFPTNTSYYISEELNSSQEQDECTATADYDEDEDDENGADDQDDGEEYTEETEEDDQGDTIQQYHYQQQQQEENQKHSGHSVSSGADDLEDQIEASTIRFSMQTMAQGSQNKTIKIKFKKERPTDGVGTPNGCNYSAYTIESIYQQEIESPSVTHENTIRRNGHHSFHPYVLGQTSTPKSSAKRQKTKLKRASTKFHMIACSSSNSSSAENGGTSGGRSTLAKASVDTTTINAKTSDDRSINNVAFNDNANYSFSSAVALDNSNCSLSTAVGRLNFRDVSGATNTSTTAGVGDFSTYQENSFFATQNDYEAREKRLTKALEIIERHMAKEAIDPFSSELCRAFLTKLDFPGVDEDTHTNYKIIQTPLPKIANTRTLSLPDGIHFNIDKEVGRGSYGSVFKATDANTGAVVALKFQKPPNTWEIYICDQVLKRIQSPSVLPGLMDISTAIIAPNASLIATEFSPFGSLLDINNKIRQSTTKVMHESLVMHFSAQICNIIHHLHKHKIIHADIKPDNFLLMRIPSTDLHYPSLRLIDFGCAIDMTLFPDADRTKFRKVIQTDGFTCIEMQEGRPWSYETDLFCIAGTVHVMLLGEYMQLQKRAGCWDIKQKLPRYLKKHVWAQFFGDMLNIRSARLPDLSEMRAIFEEEAAKMDSELQKQMRSLSNILYRR